MICRPRPRAVVALVTLAAAVVLCLGALPSAGQAADGTPSVAEAEAAVHQAEAEHERLDLSLGELTAERDQLLGDLGQRDQRRERATQDLMAARDGAHSLAVLAYMTADLGTEVLGAGPDAEGLYRNTLLRDGADARLQAASYYQDLREQADDAVTTTLTGLDAIEAEIQALTMSRDVAADEIRTASTDLEAARAAEEARRDAEREAAVELAALPDPPPAGDGGPWTPIGTIPGGPSAQQWAQLRNCESSGNYQAVSAGGTYRGAYQFNLTTWRTVGGSGDPIAASAAEQDHRAQLLWQSRGSSPWPVCGRFLR